MSLSLSVDENVKKYVKIDIIKHRLKRSNTRSNMAVVVHHAFREIAVSFHFLIHDLKKL